MRKKLLGLVIIMLILLLGGCGNKKQETQHSTTTSTHIQQKNRIRRILPVVLYLQTVFLVRAIYILQVMLLRQRRLLVQVISQVQRHTRMYIMMIKEILREMRIRKFYRQMR